MGQDVVYIIHTYDIVNYVHSMTILYIFRQDNSRPLRRLVVFLRDLVEFLNLLGIPCYIVV